MALLSQSYRGPVPTLGSINTGMRTVVQQPMPVQMPIQMGAVQVGRPMTTTVVPAGGYQQVNQAQMTYNMQVQGLNQAIELEKQIEKQLDSQKTNKEALDKRAKMRDLENKRYEVQKLERELLGLQVDPQVQRSHDRQNLANKAEDEKEKINKCQHDLEEQKIKALKAQLDLAKFDGGRIDADGKEIKAPESDPSWLQDEDVKKMIKEKKADSKEGDKKEKTKK